MTAALDVQGVVMRFGGLEALAGVSLSVQPGERRALIGPNGAGKTTLFHVISGELRPAAGSVRLFGQDITGRPPHLRARGGLSRTFQRNNLFFQLSAFENVRLAVQVHAGLGAELLRPVHTYAGINRRAEELLERTGLADRRVQRVADLSYGEQRQLELAVALAGEPKVLLLDEPTAGTSPAETQEMVNLLAALPRQITVFIVEHDMDVVAALADKITVMHYGQVLADGPAEAVRADPRVQAVYLGGAAGA